MRTDNGRISLLRITSAPSKIWLGSRDAIPKTVTPECFNRGPVPLSPVVSLVEPLLKASGNDGLVGKLRVGGHTPFSFSVGERKTINTGSARISSPNSEVFMTALQQGLSHHRHCAVR